MAITRRNFVVKVALGVAALPFLGKSALAQTKGKVGYMKIADDAPFFMALEKGLFKNQGLELEIVPMAGGAVILPGVASGDLQVGFSNVISLYQAYLQGFDFKIICGGATNIKGTNDTHALQVLKDSPIKSARDLEGKTIAVNTLNNIVHLMALAWLEKSGANPSKVKFVEIPFPQMEAALVSGRVEAISAQEPFVAASVSKGVTRVLAHPWSEAAPKFLIGTWFASEKWIQKNKETARSFVQGMNQAIDAVNADSEGARNLMPKWTGLSPDLVKQVAMPLFEKGVSEKDLQVTIDLTYKHKLIDRAFKAAEIISDLAPKG
jgi:NitT/TauT family transport system substrate-binding protein